MKSEDEWYVPAQEAPGLSKPGQPMAAWLDRASQFRKNLVGDRGPLKFPDDRKEHPSSISKNGYFLSSFLNFTQENAMVIV